MHIPFTYSVLCNIGFNFTYWICLFWYKMYPLSFSMACTRSDDQFLLVTKYKRQWSGLVVGTSCLSIQKVSQGLETVPSFHLFLYWLCLWVPGPYHWAQSLSQFQEYLELSWPSQLIVPWRSLNMVRLLQSRNFSEMKLSILPLLVLSSSSSWVLLGSFRLWYHSL